MHSAKQIEKKSPSYLTQVKTELFNLILSDHCPDRQEAQEVTDNIWKFFKGKLAQSYWNGVSGGASGKVKPRAQKLNKQGKEV